ncbi:MAG: hypothetical protein KDB27_32035, partial [Planctomycetales bacterium]|nr:hypothetical protein [Planctomycetales bacterium]
SYIGPRNRLWIDDEIPSPTDAQRELFSETRTRVPSMIDLKHPALIGPVQNQEHYMNGMVARRNNFYEPILGLVLDAYREFGELTGRHYGLLREYKTDGADTVFVSLGSARSHKLVVDPDGRLRHSFT